ncbi:MAG: HAD family hydrolase [Hyphomicrobiales bacterium]
MSGLDLVAFDADDTLWHNLIHFDAAEKRFGDMLGSFAAPADAVAALMQAEKRNIPTYGFGVKGFTLSMIETAIALSGGAVDAATITALMALGRDMLDHDMELLPHVEETLKALAASHRLLLITKGDLHHQERKVLASGLAPYFEGVEIVSDKKPDTYRGICKRHGGKVERTLMAGNSIRSDVLPMIEAGGFGVYVPFSILWDHEHEEVPPSTPRFFEVPDIRGVVEVVKGLG